MIIKKCEFIKSAAAIGDFLVSDHAEIAIAGKSNVGKSSFINFIVNNGKMARTSNTPGRTRLINYFLINNEYFFVDLPGYGYAKGSKVEIAAWGELIDDYFLSSKNLRHVIMLVDIRHLPTVEDKQFVDFLYAYRIPFSVIATKSDKLSRANIKPSLMKIATELKLGIDNIFAVSSEKKQGKDDVLMLIEKILSTEVIEEEEEEGDDVPFNEEGTEN